MKKYLWLFPNRKNLIIWLFSIIMLLGVLVFKWKPESVLLTYLFETIVIGFIHIFKLWAAYKYSTVAPTYNGRHTTNNFFTIPVFIFNYFFFIFVQSVFVFAFFQSFIPGLKDAFNVFDNYLILLSDPEMYLACLSIAFVNLAMALQNFFLPRKFERSTVKSLFLQPYLRIFVQQTVTILTGFMMMAFDAVIVSAVLLILMRLIIDIALQQAGVDLEFRKQAIHLMSKNGTENERMRAEKEINNFLEN